jgi:hypothetical protein
MVQPLVADSGVADRQSFGQVNIGDHRLMAPVAQPRGQRGFFDALLDAREHVRVQSRRTPTA